MKEVDDIGPFKPRKRIQVLSAVGSHWEIFKQMSDGIEYDIRTFWLLNGEWNRGSQVWKWTGSGGRSRNKMIVAFQVTIVEMEKSQYI